MRNQSVRLNDTLKDNMESDHKMWTALEKKFRDELKQLKSSLNRSKIRLKEKDETLNRIR